ncbi:DUF4062 domain-containing protein [Rhodoblastus acidophilus]|uniref:DUF4062 domain-containing protein n=1 Tax=Rhodoblastus acidophilus TaxID=1074 RepID=A0A6N8DH17_RHOAC|nr:DUF4062 domain-containing protein [Rhodoblastus acidophilus]MCW2272699.1 hypothetical protein [Rhodoblastus acidophilus]MTV29610.1 DUF4062 domain-containing protein [Rhodoblastus acidophilus]
MPTTPDAPKNFLGIMVSSTFTDLREHRARLLDAIRGLRFMPVGMEDVGARADLDVIDSSLKMVAESAAYIGVISRKYGQTPVCPKRNPDKLSITELEFNEAMRLKRPVLIFIMSEKHPLTEADMEFDSEKRAKLAAFRERAKIMREGSDVHRIYDVFDSLEDFSNKAAKAVGRLSEFLRTPGVEERQAPPEDESEEDILPHAPALRALPKYLGSHAFLGRAAELQALDDWSAAADPHPMLLFEAMGGSGKSILTWHWVNNGATTIRNDWCGRFWYSFYERGAVMSDFCRHALAYFKGKPVEDFVKKRTPELADLLIPELERKPWLLMLDGLERVLVAYHRYDAAQMRDEEADEATDQIAKRAPCAAIRPEDDDLLRRLAAAGLSKILVTSRLTPAALVNKSGQPVPGVRREFLRGLRPPDAESLFRACGVTGDSQAIQTYLQSNCDCHPLVTGALAGLVNDYPPDRGNFELWAADPSFGGKLNLAELDLTQKRNHILLAAINALRPESLQLLQTLALLQAGATFDTLKNFNPHLPPQPHDETKLNKQRVYLASVEECSHEYAVRDASERLWNTIRDLEKRGLLQYDGAGKRYDLHPVMRGVAAGRMGDDDARKLGQQVVDFFSIQPHNAWVQAETLDDLAIGLQILQTLLRMERFQEAAEFLEGDFSNALIFNLDAKEEIAALMKPFFPNGWSSSVGLISKFQLLSIKNIASFPFIIEKPLLSIAILESAVPLGLEVGNVHNVRSLLSNIMIAYDNSNKIHSMSCVLSFLAKIEPFLVINDDILRSACDSMFYYTIIGMYDHADKLWKKIDSIGEMYSIDYNYSGYSEYCRAEYLFCLGELEEGFLLRAEGLADNGRNRLVVKALTKLRGRWHMLLRQPQEAVVSLARGVRLAREAGQHDSEAEALLALAQLRAGHRIDARADAERLDGKTKSLYLAELWRESGHTDRAIVQALRAHEWAVADGEPYVRRYELNRARDLLEEFGAELPEVPQFDPSKAKGFPWEKDVDAFIEKLKVERAAKERKQKRVVAQSQPER